MTTTIDVLSNGGQQAHEFRWHIRRVAEANNPSVPKYADRDRIGKVVRLVFPLTLGMPFHLQYIGGPKDGGVIEHSRIADLTVTDTTVEVVTQGGTLVVLELVDEAKVSKWHREFRDDMYGGDGDGADV